MIAFGIAIVLVNLAISAQAADLPFDLALKTMLAANESVKAAYSETERRDYEARAAQGLYFPKITLTGRATRMDEPIDLDLNSIRDVILALHPGGSVVGGALIYSGSPGRHLLEVPS